MRSNLAFAAALGLFLALIPVAESRSQDASPSEPHGTSVVVEVASGRVFAAALHPSTDDTTLWLRARHGTMSISRPIRWDRVVRAKFQGQSLSAEQFRQAMAGAESHASTDLAPNSAEPGAFRLRSLRSAPADTAATASGDRGPSPAAGNGASRAEPARVESLAVDAWVANWDNDVEVDGLVVEVRPQGAAGAVVAAHGTLEVTLLGWRSDGTRSEAPPVRIGRWARAVRPADFVGGPARYRLPFQSVHPSFHLRWAPRGTVHVRLGVSGQGVFDATSSSVRIRPYSGLRDHLQQTTGQRFYEVERTGRGRR